MFNSSFLWPSKSIRLFAVLLATAALTVGSSHAKSPKTGRSRRSLSSLTRAFIQATLPSVGIMPDDEHDVPTDGKKYELKLVSAQSREMIDVVYRIDDTYVPEALNRLNLFLRDSHNSLVAQYDPRTFDVLHTMLTKLGKSQAVIDILSAYRSKETNEMLRDGKNTNAAEHSQHMLGKAMDIRIPGVPTATVRDAALSLKAGGVGYYPVGQFVHVDVGPVRRWTFSLHSGMRRLLGRHS